MQLVKYEAARKALQEANAVDEVKDLRDKAEALRAYAKQARDFEMANWAAEIRIRAERKLGEMLKAQKEAGGMNKGKLKQGKKLPQSHDETTEAPTLSDMGITKSMSSRAQAIASVPESEFEQTIAEHRDQQTELTSATMHKLTESGKAHVSHNSGENEWYTPPEYIEAARNVMGGIDLDPASSKIANQMVKAAKYFTAENNGLEKKWKGRVWINPPYAQPLINEFSKKICESLESMEQAIVLVNNATETSWFQNMAKVSASICFVDKRIRFLDPAGKPGAPLQGQAALYFGGNIKKFVAEYARFGVVLTHV